MSKRKTGSRLVSLLMAVLMLIAYMPLLGEAAYAETGVPEITTDKAVYTVGEDVKVTTALNDAERGWIGLYRKSDTAPFSVTSVLWYYPADFDNPKVLQSIDGVTQTGSQNWGDGSQAEGILPGEYQLVYVPDSHGSPYAPIGEPAYFTVVEEQANNTIKTDKDTYYMSDPIMVTIKSDITSYTWVGLYGKDETPNGDSNPPSILWKDDHSFGTAFNLLEWSSGHGEKNREYGPGEYKVVFFGDGGFTNIVDTAYITIEADPTPIEPSTLSVDKRVYKVNESINVSATSGYPNAWVGFYPYRGGDPLDNGDLAAHYTLADAGVETVDIVNDEAVIDKEKVKDLPDGRYKVILFTDGWAIDDSRGSMCIESFYVYDPDKLFTWYEEDGEWKAYATFTDQGPTEVDAVVTADTTDATCSAAGEKVYTASVNADAIDGAITGSFAAALKTAAPYTDTKTVEIPKKDHTPGDTVKENVVAPECGKAGSHDDVVYCTVCEAEISRTHVDDAALEHDYQEVADSAKAATCTEPGKEADKKCSRCDDVVTGAEIPALGHDYQEVADSAKAATCTEAGKEADKKCSRCDDVITGAEIAALGHKPKKVEAKEATTEAEGNIEYWTCETCGKFFSDAEGKTEITKEDTVIPKIEEDPTEDPAATEAVEEAKKAAEAAEAAKKTADASKEAADKAAATPGQAAVDAAQKALNDANAAKAAADEAKAKAEAAQAATEAAYPGDSDFDKAKKAEAQELVDAATEAAKAAATKAEAAQKALDAAKAAATAAASAAKTQTPAEIVDLPAVKISKPKAAKKKITVKWKKVSKKNQKKIQGVEIQVATDAGFTDIVKTANGSKKKVSKAVKGLKSKTKYYVRIRAYKNAADGKHVSAWKTKSVKVK